MCRVNFVRARLRWVGLWIDMDFPQGHCGPLLWSRERPILFFPWWEVILCDWGSKLGRIWLPIGNAPAIVIILAWWQRYVLQIALRDGGVAVGEMPVAPGFTSCSQRLSGTFPAPSLSMFVSAMAKDKLAYGLTGISPKSVVILKSLGRPILVSRRWGVILCGWGNWLKGI